MEKPGIRTTEFWLGAGGMLLNAVIALLIGYGFINSEQGELWAGLGAAILSISVPLSIAQISKGYSESRARVKESANFIKE